jgi:hypothetical protein
MSTALNPQRTGHLDLLRADAHSAANCEHLYRRNKKSSVIERKSLNSIPNKNAAPAGKLRTVRGA